jgi:hypothetical protein
MCIGNQPLDRSIRHFPPWIFLTVLLTVHTTSRTGVSELFLLSRITTIAPTYPAPATKTTPVHLKKEEHTSFFFPASPAPPTRDSPLLPVGPPLPSSSPARLPCSSPKQSSFPYPTPRLPSAPRPARELEEDESSSSSAPSVSSGGRRGTDPPPTTPHAALRPTTSIYGGQTFTKRAVPTHHGHGGYAGAAAATASLVGGATTLWPWSGAARPTATPYGSQVSIEEIPAPSVGTMLSGS